MGISIEQYRVSIGSFCSISQKSLHKANITECIHPLVCKVIAPWPFDTTSHICSHIGFVCKHCSKKTVHKTWNYYMSLWLIQWYIHRTAGILQNLPKTCCNTVRFKKRIPKQKQPYVRYMHRPQIKRETTGHIVFNEYPHLYENPPSQNQMDSDCSYYSSLWTLMLYLNLSSSQIDTMTVSVAHTLHRATQTSTHKTMCDYPYTMLPMNDDKHNMHIIHSPETSTCYFEYIFGRLLPYFLD